MAASMTAASREISRHGHFTRWSGAVLGLGVALIFFLWAGSGADATVALPWGWTKTGWIIPVAGLGTLWIAAALVFWLLSFIAYLLFNPVERAVTLRPWVSVSLILGGGILLRAVIVHEWTPLVLHGLGPGWRWLPMAGDGVVIAVLLLALGGTGRSLWWAALYAFHPLVLLEIAGNGHWVGWCMAVILLGVATAHRWPAKVRAIMVIIAAAGAVAAIALLPVRGEVFNSLGADVCKSFGWNGVILLPVVAAILEGLVVWIALGRGWTIARAFLHIGMIALLCAPVVRPWFVVAVVALLPLAWNGAGWVLSLTVLGAYVSLVAAPVGGGHQVPEWVLIAEWIPVGVMEVWELAVEVAATISSRRIAGASVPPVSALS